MMSHSRISYTRKLRQHPNKESVREPGACPTVGRGGEGPPRAGQEDVGCPGQGVGVREGKAESSHLRGQAGPRIAMGFGSAKG